MKTGDLTTRITLMEPVSAKDPDGMVIQTFVDRGTVWANIQYRPGSEVFQQARMEARDPATVAVPAVALTRRITSEWQIETADSVFKVRGNPFPSQDRAHIVFQVEGRRK